MADILYTIEYTEKDGFKEPVQTVLALGTQPDRVAFVITELTAAEMEKEGKRVALKRHGQDPFDVDLEKLYVVPIETQPFTFFTVKEKQDLLTGHLICGELDKNGNFEPFAQHSTATPPVPLVVKKAKEKREKERKEREKEQVSKLPPPSLPIPN